MNSKLREKLKENWQRRVLERFLAEADPDLSNLLNSSEVLYGGDGEAVMSKWPFPTFKNGVLTTTKGNIEDYKFEEYSLWSEVEERANNLSFPGAVYFLWLDNEGPVFKVQGSDIESRVESLLEFSRNHYYSAIVIALENGSSGIIIDNYCGYLPQGQHKSNQEIVFEFSEWRI